MPVYIFKHPKKEKYIEIVMGMNEEHRYIQDGTEWERQWTIPNAGIDTAIDPFSQKDFVEKTSNKRGTYGDMLDRSKEAALKREEKEGKDPVKEAYYKDYTKRTGKVSHAERQELIKKVTVI